MTNKLKGKFSKECKLHLLENGGGRLYIQKDILALLGELKSGPVPVTLNITKKHLDVDLKPQLIERGDA